MKIGYLQATIKCAIDFDENTQDEDAICGGAGIGEHCLSCLYGDVAITVMDHTATTRTIRHDKNWSTLVAKIISAGGN